MPVKLITLNLIWAINLIMLLENLKVMLIVLKEVWIMLFN